MHFRKDKNKGEEVGIGPIFVINPLVMDRPLKIKQLAVRPSFDILPSLFRIGSGLLEKIEAFMAPRKRL